MRFDHSTKSLGVFFAAVLLTSCRTMSGDGGLLNLLTLATGAEPSAADTQLTGTLVRRGDCLAIDGNGNTVVIWPRTGNAVPRPGIGTVIVVWPRQATLRPGGESGSGEAGINVVVVWPVAGSVSAPVRVGERIEMIGGMKDDLAGLPLARPAPRGCSGRAFVARDFRPAAPR